MAFLNTTLKLSAVSLAVLLSACSTQRVAQTEQRAEGVMGDAQAEMRRAQLGDPARRADADAVVVRDDVFIPMRRAKADEVRVVPPVLREEVVINRSFESLFEVAERFTALTGVRLVIAPDVGITLSGEAPAAPGLPGQAPGASSMNASAVSAATPFRVNFSGSRAAFLDLVAARYGVAWKHENGEVHVFEMQTKTFRLAALPGETSLKASVGSSSNSSAEGGGTQGSESAQTSSAGFAMLSVWKGIEDSVKQMVSPRGRFIVSPATGTLTITDTPSVLRRVEEFIRGQNDALSRQVLINVRVLAVERTASENYGVNWSAVYNNINRNFGIEFSSNINPVAGAGSLTLSAPAGATPSTGWRGSEALIYALSEQGRVSQLTSASIITLNNQPAPIQVGRQTTYLASATANSVAEASGSNAVSSVTLTPGKITTGFSMNVVPHVLDDARLMLQYSIDLSSLIDLKRIASAQTAIEAPEVQTRNLLQRVVLRSGETLVVTGFDDALFDANRAGVGSADNVAVGGRAKGRETRTTMVVLIQPLIMKITN